MGNGIVHMEQIEVVVDDHVYHGTGEGYLIGWVVEQWIGRHPHLMVKNIRIKNIQSHRLLVRDEMYLMTFVGQGFAQFSRQYTAAAESGITYNSYFHISAVLGAS